MMQIMLEYILPKHVLLLTISQIPWADDITVNKPLHLSPLQWQHLPKSAGGIGPSKLLRAGAMLVPAF